MGTATGTFTFTGTAAGLQLDVAPAVSVVGYHERPTTPRVYVSATGAKTVGEFGVLRVHTSDGVDLTSFRGVPCQVRGWGSVDPGGHDAATIEFPQITLAEVADLGTGDLDWYYDGVVLRISVQNAGVVTNLWRGRIRAIDLRESRVAFECDGDLIGPMSWATYRPSIDRQVEDIGWSVSKQVPLGARVNVSPPLPNTGIVMERTGSRSDSRWGWATSTLALAQTSGGIQWTLLPDPGEAGVYHLQHRDLTTHDLTIHIGLPGVAADLLHDITARPTRYYGEGQRPDGGRWYGAVFPYLDLDTVPTFPGTMSLGDTGEGVTLLFRTLGRFGMSYDDVRGSYSPAMKDAVENVQEEAGLPVTGVCNEATWNAIFSPATTGSLYGAYYAPLVQRNATRAFNRSPSGLILGTNPDYNPRVPIVDSFVGFGAGVEKSTAREWFRAQMQQDFSTPEWSGSITLTTDPQEMSRFAIRAGMNFWAPEFGGSGAVFHIAAATVDWQSGSVSCDVSTRGRDYLDLATILERNKAARANPGKRFAAALSRRSALSQDMRPGWDYEGGAGVVTETACDAGTWTVIPVFVGQAGSIGEVHLKARDYPTEWCMAIFARKVTPAQLNSMAPSPLATRTDDGSWTTDAGARDTLYGFGRLNPDDEAQYNVSGRTSNGKLLVYAAGTPTTPSDAPLPCGYWPYTDAGKPDNDTVGGYCTGEWKDDSAFDYWTYDGPFLHVAIWAREATTIHGRLYPSMTDGGM